MNILKLIAEWYFQTGWLIACIAGFVVGLTCKPKTVAFWCVGMLAVGLFLMFVKNHK